ncbi:retrovirus-related pol polyprotein from transposon TNT 1-94 [Tanacetum coccineum]
MRIFGTNFSVIMSVLPDDQMNYVINCLTAKSTWDDLILYHDGPSDVKESRVMDLKLCYNTFKYQRSIYETEKNKSLVSATPLSTAFFSTFVVQDFQNSPDDEEDTRSSHEYLNDLEEEYQARALLAKSKRFFKKGTQRFSSAKSTDQTECHKCGKKDHFARDCWSKTSVPSYQSPFQSRSLSSPQHKPELRPTKDFEAKYNKVKAKLTLLSSSDSASKASTVKNKGLIAEAYEWDEEEVSSDDNEMVEVKVLMALAEDNDAVSNEGARNGEWVKISMRKYDIKKPIYPPDEYLHPYEPSQRYKTNSNYVSFIETYESPEPVVLETKASSDQNGQTNQNDQTAQTDEILNDNLSENSNHNNDEQIIDNLPNTEDIQISEHLSSLNVEDTLVQYTISIPNPPLPIPSVVTPAPQDRWSQDKHIELVNIIRNPWAGMLTRAMAKQLSVASSHECLFVDFLSKEEPKKVSESLKHPG